MSKAKTAPQPVEIRDRVRELRRVPASTLRPHPKNAREHPESQRKAMREVLSNLGFAGAILAVEREGELLTCDGHLRSEEMGQREVPVLVLDLDDAEVETLLLTFDPIAQMAITNHEKAAVLAEAAKQNHAGLKDTIAAVMENLGAQATALMAANQDAKVIKFDVSKPPAMAWVLIGIPTARYGEIAADMERLAARPGIVLDTVVNGTEPQAHGSN